MSNKQFDPTSLSDCQNNQKICLVLKSDLYKVFSNGSTFKQDKFWQTWRLTPVKKGKKYHGGGVATWYEAKDSDALEALVDWPLKDETEEKMELKITKEKILEAADKCPQAKETLKTLFPEVFEEDKYLDFSKLTCSVGPPPIFTYNAYSILQKRTIGSLKNKGFLLNAGFDWSIQQDDLGYSILVPTKKI